MRTTRNSILTLFVMTTLMACGEEPTKVVPKGSADQGQDLSMPDMSEPDLSEPDMAEPDMAEPDLSMPDMAEPDMAMDPMVSGDWILKKYEEMAPTDTLASFTLVNVMGSTEVTGTFMQGAENGEVAGTYSAPNLSLEWTIGGQTYQFVNGAFDAAQIKGTYNDPASGGLPQDAVLVRPE